MTNVLDKLFGALSPYHIVDIFVVLTLVLVLINLAYTSAYRKAMIKTQISIKETKDAVRHLKYKVRLDESLKTFHDKYKTLKESVKNKALSDESKENIWEDFRYAFIKYIESGMMLFKNDEAACNSKTDKKDLIDELVLNGLRVIDGILKQVNVKECISFYKKELRLRDTNLYSDLIEYVKENGTEPQIKKLTEFTEL